MKSRRCRRKWGPIIRRVWNCAGAPSVRSTSTTSRLASSLRPTRATRFLGGAPGVVTQAHEDPPHSVQPRVVGRRWEPAVQGGHRKDAVGLAGAADGGQRPGGHDEAARVVARPSHSPRE